MKSKSAPSRLRQPMTSQVPLNSSVSTGSQVSTLSAKRHSALSTMSVTLCRADGKVFQTDRQLIKPARRTLYDSFVRSSLQIIYTHIVPTTTTLPQTAKCDLYVNVTHAHGRHDLWLLPCTYVFFECAFYAVLYSGYFFLWSCGVPQGSVLGRSTTLRHVYHPTQHSYLLTFSKPPPLRRWYSTFFSFHPRNFDSSIAHLQTALKQISSWMSAYLLTLNSSKIEFLIIGLKQQPSKSDNSSLNTTHSARNLSKSCYSHIRELRGLSVCHTAIVKVGKIYITFTKVESWPRTSFKGHSATSRRTICEQYRVISCSCGSCLMISWQLASVTRCCSVV